MKLLIVIPAYNEEGSIGQVIEELRKKVPEMDYIVVNDGSSDRTAALCREMGCPLLDLPANLGLTGAVQAGLRYAYETGYDAAVQIDGDGQHDPSFLPAMAARMEEKDLDLVIGSRFVGAKKPRSLRMLGSNIIETAIRLTTGKRITDPTSGMRMYSRRILKEMAYGLNARPEPDTVAWLLRKGARMEEMQVAMRDRTAGESYLNLGRSALYMVQMCMNIFFLQWVIK